jgi:AbrB family looped-hinge helix DNA binding protein
VATVKVSRKLQIVVPAEARRALAIEPGDRLEVTVEDGTLRLRPLPRNPLAALRRRHGTLWHGGSKWLEEERQAWSNAT